MRIRFGEYIFDDVQRELLRHGDVVHLSPRAFELLAFLIRRRPEALPKDELYRHLWPDTFVEYANLNNLISEIRSAIHDRSRTKLRTKHRFGYAFTAESVEESPVIPRTYSRTKSFALVIGDHAFPLATGMNVIGRDDQASIVVDSPLISRAHARIIIQGQSATIEDLGSKNGTFVESTRVDRPHRLKDGDVIHFGTVVAVFRAERHPTTTITGERQP
ncbi:MAG: FHA domain-containing protein [Acidobacteriota bacterium]